MIKSVVLLGVIFSLCVTHSVADRKNDILFNEYGSFDSKAVFYREEYLNGQSTELETRGPCKNLPKSWHRKALSVDTKGTCSLVCDEADCKGTCKYIYPNRGEQRLSEIGLEAKVVSLSGCFQNRN